MSDSAPLKSQKQHLKGNPDTLWLALFKSALLSQKGSGHSVSKEHHQTKYHLNKINVAAWASFSATPPRNFSCEIGLSCASGPIYWDRPSLGVPFPSTQIMWMSLVEVCANLCSRKACTPCSYTQSVPLPDLTSRDRSARPQREKASPSMGFIWRALLTPRCPWALLQSAGWNARMAQDGGVQSPPKGHPEGTATLPHPPSPPTAIPCLEATGFSS